MTDSIRYAKHIQNSILPSDELMKQAFPDHFVLYKPKDIVSGDFYWASIINGKSYVAAVDCTGVAYAECLAKVPNGPQWTYAAGGWIAHGVKTFFTSIG